MKAMIFHWRGAELPEGTMLEPVKMPDGEFVMLPMLDIPDLWAFAQTYGDIRVKAPSDQVPYWTVFITTPGTGWGQR
jgi:hypothetical protein